MHREYSEYLYCLKFLATWWMSLNTYTVTLRKLPSRLEQLVARHRRRRRRDYGAGLGPSVRDRVRIAS